MNKLGGLIREKREEKGLSQRQLAEKIDVSNTEISRIESGERRSPAPYILRRMAPHLGVTYRRLLELSGYKDLVLEEPVEREMVREDWEAYASAVEDFCDQETTPEEAKKIAEYKKFLISQRQEVKKDG